MSNSQFKLIMLGVAIGGLVLLGIHWEVEVWKECLDKNSFVYCVRILGNR